MDISLVRAGLATNARAVEGLTCLGYMPDSAEPPMFFPGPADIIFDRAMGRGMDQLQIVCFLLVGRTDDLSSQTLLDGYLKGGGPTSVRAALATERTLGGACDDLRVEGIAGYRFIEYNGIRYLGAQITVMVIGRGD